MKIRFRVLFIIWIVVILAVSSIPDLTITSKNFTWIDKIAHFVEYGIWAFLFFMMLKQEDKIRNQKSTFLIIIDFGFFLALIDEIHQIFIPGRNVQIFDFIANILGIIVVLLIFNKKTHRTRKRHM